MFQPKGRQPAQPLGTDVPDGAHEVEDGEGRAGDPEAGPAAGGELAGQRGQRDRDQPGPHPRGPEPERAGDRESPGDVRQGHEGTDADGEHDPFEHGRGQQRVAADRRAGEQLGMAGLLLAAGVPAHHDHEHQGQDHGVEHRHLRHRQLAEAVHVEDRPVERHHGGVVVDGPGGVHPVRGRLVERRGRGRGRVDDQDQQRDPDRRPGAGRGAVRSRATQEGAGVSASFIGWVRYASRNSSSSVGGALVRAVTPASVSRWSTSASASGSTVQGDRVVLDREVVDAGQPVETRPGPARRWR